MKILSKKIILCLLIISQQLYPIITWKDYANYVYQQTVPYYTAQLNKFLQSTFSSFLNKKINYGADVLCLINYYLFNILPENVQSALNIITEDKAAPKAQFYIITSNSPKPYFQAKHITENNENIEKRINLTNTEKNILLKELLKRFPHDLGKSIIISQNPRVEELSVQEPLYQRVDLIAPLSQKNIINIRNDDVSFLIEYLNKIPKNEKIIFMEETPGTWILYVTSAMNRYSISSDIAIQSVIAALVKKYPAQITDNQLSITDPKNIVIQHYPLEKGEFDLENNL